MDPKEVQISLSVNPEGIKEGVQQAETILQQGLERMNKLGQQPDTQIPSGGLPGGSVPAPLPKPPVPGDPQQSTPESSPIAAAWKQIEEIKAISNKAPDVALAQLQGSGDGGLMGRVRKAAVADPENADQYQKLITALKDLTRSVGENSKKIESSNDGGGGAGLMGFLGKGAMLGGLASIAGQALNGNLLGAAGGAIGGAIGLLGGPLGVAVGSAIGSSIGGFVDNAAIAQNYDITTADIAARFGDFSQEEGLKLQNMQRDRTFGYTTEQTAELIDRLRQTRVVSEVDENTKALVESLQALTRATGQNTEAIVQQYSSYKTAGGRDTPETYMNQMIAGAVAAGMRSNLQEYQEMLGSARMQLVYRTGQGDYGDGAMRGIQGTLTNLLGGQSRTAQLLRDNPAMAQQALGSFLSTGGAKAYSRDSAAMQLAGIHRADTDEAFLTPEQMVLNAATRTASVATGIMPRLAQITGMSQEQLQEAARSNPNLLQDLTTNNQNKDQKDAIQRLVREQFNLQYGRNPTAQDTQIFSQLGTQAIANNGKIDLNTPMGGGKTAAELIQESQKTEGDKARELQTKQHEEMLKLMNEFKPILLEIQKATVEMMKAINTLVVLVKPIAESIKTVLAGLGLQTPGVTVNQAGEPAKTFEGQIKDVSSWFEADPKKRASALLQGAIQRGTQPSGNTSSQSTVKSVAEMASSIARLGKGSAEVILRSDPAHQAIRGALGILTPGKKQDDKKTVDAAFNDTPSGGVVAGPGFDTFQFAHGDVIHAAKGGDFGGGSSGNGQITINITQTFNGSVDAETVRGASRAGVQSGADDFWQIWNSRVSDRNRPRSDRTMY